MHLVRRGRGLRGGEEGKGGYLTRGRVVDRRLQPLSVVIHVAEPVSEGE